MVNRKEGEVGIKTGSARVVIPGGEVHVAANLPALPSGDQRGLAVRLEAAHAVDDVCPRLFKPSRPLNVCRLIKARLQLHQHNHLFPCACRLDQVTGDA